MECLVLFNLNLDSSLAEIGFIQKKQNGYLEKGRHGNNFC